MKKSQILYLVIGLIFLAGGFWALIRMTQVNQEALQDHQIQETSQSGIGDAAEKKIGDVTEKAVGDEAGSETENTAAKETEEKSGLTKGLEWLTSQGIPVWVYVLVFVVFVMLLRIADTRMQVKRYEMRRAQQEAAEAGQGETEAGQGEGKELSAGAQENQAAEESRE